MDMTSPAAPFPLISPSSLSHREPGDGHATAVPLSSNGHGGATRGEHATLNQTTAVGVGGPQELLLRTPSSRSVQFEPLMPSMSRQRSFRGGGGDTDHAGDGRASASSSADETTRIMRRDRGQVRTYSSVESTVVAVDTRGSRRLSESRRSRRSSRQSNRSEERELDCQNQQRDGWFKTFVDKYGSVELDNKGSVARDHLALERTFLAWLRTSLAFASIGVAITQLFRLNSASSTPPSSRPQHLKQVGKPLGATFLAISIVVLFIGFHRYFESQHWIIRGKFPASRGGVAIVTALGGALIVVSLVAVLVVGGGTFEK